MVSSGSGSRGGGEIYLSLLAKGLREQGCEVQALIPDSEGMDELAKALASDASVVRFPFVSTYERPTRLLGAISDRPQQNRVTRLLQDLRPDVVHVNQQVAEDGCDLLLASKRSGLPWVSTIHVGRSAAELGARGGSMRDRACAQVIRLARGTHIAVSDQSRDQLADRFPFEGSNFQAVHNGTSVSQRAGLEEVRQRVREEWGVGESEIVIGSVGRIEAQKNPVGFVEAVAGLSSGGRVKCVWIGDGTLRSAITDAARAAEVPLHIDGWRQDADQRLAGFDIFFLPSLFEGLPFAVLEAMHAGLPVVTSEADGLGEAIRDGGSGFLCKTAGQFAERLQRLVEDPELRKRMGETARDDAREGFSLEAMASKTRAVYRSVVASAAGK
ncbi:hypothetical protein GCM10009076_14840 [Erythrobacter ramosus]